jgi:hypothetical protein
MGPCKNPSPAAVLGPSGTGGPPLPGFGMPPLNPERLLGCREGACEKSGTANNEFDVAWKQTTARSGSQQVAIRYHPSSTRGSLYLVRPASSCEQLIVLVKLKPGVYASIVMQSSVLSIIMLARSQGLSITNTMSCSGPVIHNGRADATRSRRQQRSFLGQHTCRMAKVFRACRARSCSSAE